MLLLVLTTGVSVAQNAQGRWALGLHGGGSMWVNDYNERKYGGSGELFLRYGAARIFSIGVMGGYEELKALQNPILPGTQDNYLHVDGFPAALVGWFHLMPGKKFSPYVYAGGGAMFYKRKDGLKRPVPLGEDKFQTTYYIPVGVGFEAFASPNVAFTLDLGYRLLDDETDAYKYNAMDGFATAKAGFNFYLGSSDADDDDQDGLNNGEERRLGTNPKVPDTDGDGLKDGEEVNRYRTDPLKRDTDGDGLSDGDEISKYKTDPAKADTDGDGLSDGDEVLKHNTDPLKVDTDGDGLSDGDEVLTHKSDPLKVDTDGDGLSDWDEVKTHKTDPARVDTDGDGLADGDEVRKYKTNPTLVDSDGGGINDGAEITRGTNPLDPKDDVLKETIILEKGKSVVLEGVNFATGSARLTKNSETTLEKAFIALVANPDVKVEIAGYTDNVGSVQLNDRLSRQRAESVRTWLVKKGISPARLTAVGKGMRDPIASNDTPEGRAQNRRIEFHVQK